MRNSNQHLFFIFLSFSSCKENKQSSIEQVLTHFQASGSTIVNEGSDSSFYKLFVATPKEEYYTDNAGNLIFLITKRVFSSNIDRGIANKDNIGNAIKHHTDSNRHYSQNNIYFLYTISILNSKRIFEPVWNWKNFLYLNDNGYSVFDVDVRLEASYSEFRGKPQSMVRLNFKTKDYDNGYILYTLNYSNSKGIWQLLFREKVNTVLSENLLTANPLHKNK